MLRNCFLSLCLVVNVVFSTSIVFDSGEHFNVSWTFSDADITFTVVAETNGWVGLGFSPSGSMAGSDIIIGWVDDSGIGHIKDCHATANTLPTVDNSQDVELLVAGESDGVTTLTFKRNLNTGDGEDNIIRSDTTRLIWAYSTSDPQDNQLSRVDYHGTNRGAKSTYLLDWVAPKITLPSDSKTHTIRDRNVTIPADDTTYWCSWHKLPTFTQKQHVLKTSVEFTPGTEAFVHHIIVYGCHGVTDQDIEEHGGASGRCHTAEMPNFYIKCSEIMFGWAVGGGDAYFPEEAGYPLGPGTNSPDYVLLELHYDNPNLEEGVVDSTGLSITYSPTLRENDIGVLSIGMVTGIIVPPGDDGFSVRGYCHSECTKQAFPSEGITVLSYLLHAHLLGAGIKLDHYRNGKLLGTIAADNYYDFNYQEWRLFQEPLKLLPGDHLETTCSMKSTDRTNVTYGGLGTREEMCLSFLNYYPAQNFSSCSSLPEYLFEDEAKLYTELGVKPRKSGSFMDINSALAEITWNDEKRDQFEKLTLGSSYRRICTGLGGHQYGMEEMYVGEKGIASASTVIYINMYLLSYVSLISLKYAF